VGDSNSDAVIKLNTTKIYRGGPIRLRSFRLRQPHRPTATLDLVPEEFEAMP
jgi:hypothetical protein